MRLPHLNPKTNTTKPSETEKRHLESIHPGFRLALRLTHLNFSTTPISNPVHNNLPTTLHQYLTQYPFHPPFPNIRTSYFQTTASVIIHSISHRLH